MLDIWKMTDACWDGLDEVVRQIQSTQRLRPHKSRHSGELL